MEKDRFFLVDWDIPIGSRRMFYYYLNKIRAKRELSGDMSSRSVMMVADADLAREVYDLTSKYGRASLYLASPLTRRFLQENSNNP